MKPIQPNRRDFLIGSLAAGGGLASLGGLDPLGLLGGPARANEGEGNDQYYVLSLIHI